jgi:penicillin amidase
MDTRLGSWPSLHALLQALTGLSAEAAALRERLLAWDGHMDADSEDAGAFAAWRSALVLALAGTSRLSPLAAPNGYSPLFGPWLHLQSRIGFALETLIAKGSQHGVDVNGAAMHALEQVAAPAAAGTGSTSTGGATAWGTTHTVLPLHALAEHRATASAAPTVPVTGLSGDTGCVLSTESLPGVTDGSFRGPVARYVWDLADRGSSRWIVPFGSSGVPGHPHFASQLPLWAAGDLVPVLTDWEQLTKETK